MGRQPAKRAEERRKRGCLPATAVSLRAGPSRDILPAMKRLLPLVLVLSLCADDAKPVLLRYKAEAGTVLRYRVRIVNRQEAKSGDHAQSITFERVGRRTLLLFDRTQKPPRITLSSEDETDEARILAYTEDGKDRLEAARADIQPTLPRATKQLAFFTLDDQGREQEDLTKLPLDAALLRSLSDIQVLPDAAATAGDTWKRELRAGPLVCRYEYAVAGADPSQPARVEVHSKFAVETDQPPPGQTLSFQPGEVAMRFDAEQGVLQWLQGKVGVTASAPGKEDALTLTLELELEGVERLRPEALTKVAEEGGFLATVYRAYETGILDRASLGLEEFVQRFPESRWSSGAKEMLDGLRGTFPLLLTEAPPVVAKEWLGAAPDTKGKVVLVAFWTTWEGNCRAAVPSLAKWAEAFGSQGLVVEGVTSLDDKQDRAAVGEFVSQQGIQFPIAIDDGEKTFAAFRVATIPHLFLIDKLGRVRWEGHPSQATVVEYEIRSLLAE